MTYRQSVRFDGVDFRFSHMRNGAIIFKNDNGDTRTYVKADNKTGTLIYMGQRWKLSSAHFLPKKKV